MTAPIQAQHTAPRNHQALVDDVVRGLSKTTKEISTVWLYDEIGSLLFDAICELPEYYPTRTELGIMADHAAEMASAIGAGAALIEFGSGSSIKTRLLLDRLESPVAYVPVDISRMHLLDAASDIARDYPRLRVAPVCADFTQPFRLPGAAFAERRVVYFPGSTVGNFAAPAARKLLTSIRALIGSSGATLIGADLRKDPAILMRAYNDSRRLTARFNLNVLRHLNRELSSDFNLQAFEHAAVWVDPPGRIEMRLVSLHDQVVTIGDHVMILRHGEYIRTEYSHKYTVESFAALAESAGLRVCRVWRDAAALFSVQLLEPA